MVFTLSCIVAGVLVYLSDVYLSDTVFLKEAGYNFYVQDNPQITGIVYNLSENKLLIAVKSKDRVVCGYLLDLKEKTIGLPNFFKYIPVKVFHFAFVHESVNEGFPPEGEFAANIEVASNKITFVIRGQINPEDSEIPQVSLYRQAVTLTKK